MQHRAGSVGLALALTLIVSAAARGADDPRITSWYTLDSSRLARLYRTPAKQAANQPETTWSNGRNTQAFPVRCGVQQISSSSNWVYVSSTGLPGQIMGPWEGGRFPNLPVDQHFIFAIPLHPVKQSGDAWNRLFEIGMFVDGVRMFDACDAFSYSHARGQDANPRAGIGQGDGIWRRDALVNEGQTFDAALAHQQNWGTYHYHVQPIALRYRLGDHVDFDPATQTYHESAGQPRHHSPILGWLQDGYPIYGPYGYANPTNPASGLRRMDSGFVPRDGRRVPDNLAATGRRQLPAWEAREEHRSAVLTDAETGPEVSDAYPVGHYLEDYAYLGDFGKTQGRDFDLDELNGRWCVTPEFPAGTYAYFTAIDARGNPVYPYNMGRRYYGKPVGCLMRGIFEPVTTNFVAAAEADTAATPKDAPRGSKLIWRDGGYQTR